MSLFLSRTWAEINLDNIQHNFNLIKSKLNSKTKIMAVVKADAYGHGAKFLAKEFDNYGADWFAVSNLEEALQLRSFKIKKPILILGYTPPEMAKSLADNNISQAILGLDYAKKLAYYAKKESVKVKIHIKVDSGMSRIGFVHHNLDNNGAIDEISEALSSQNLIPEGIFTHFATSDLDNDENGLHTKEQFSLFMDCIKKLKNIGISFELKHCANSAATLNNPEYHLDMVRPGIILYGLNPSSYFTKYDLKPAFNLKSVVSLTKDLNKYDCISYGRTFTAENRLSVATIPVGYADGYSRNLSNNGYVMINGKKANILGRVCMDQIIVDISNIANVEAGNTVLLFGEDKNGTLTIDDFSSMTNTINYETICIIGKRVPRIYIKNGKEYGILNLIYNQED